MNANLAKLIQEIGENEAHEILMRHQASPEASTLTIVSNAGTHHLPSNFARGEVFIASEGNFDFSSSELVKEQYQLVLTRLSKKLLERSWQTIYLVPFGHSTLSMQIKLLVYKVCRLETIDVFYNAGSYSDIAIEQRAIIVNCESD